MWAASAQYRLVGNQPGVAPDERASVADCIEDAKDAVRYVRERAEELRVDTQRIVAGGGSAGGHLAAATAVVPDGEEPPSGKSISCKPNLLVLLNPALFHQSAQGTLKLQHFTRETPPAIMFYGMNDPMLKDIGRPLQA
jgi:acetyl esterase